MSHAREGTGDKLAHLRLMNKDRCVLEFDYDPDLHLATHITSVEDAAIAPIGLFDESGNVTVRDLYHWWRHRAIPPARERIERVLDDLCLDSTLELAEMSLGLSLTDRYWIDDTNAPQRWTDINFFDNDFAGDLGILTLGQDSDPSITVDYDRARLPSPDTTTGGNLQKKWAITGGTRTLIKAGVGITNQEPYNEVIATELHRRLLTPGTYVPYRLYTENRRTYSACDNMPREDEELVCAWDLIRRRRRKDGESDLALYARCCDELGLANVMDTLEGMVGCDHILANRDRHWRNFGVIRNVETLQVTRMAPIFDTGAGLWRSMVTLEPSGDFSYRAKPFAHDGMQPMTS